jgi:hypothetical protein
MATNGTLKLAWGVHNAPRSAPPKVLRQVDSEAQALAVSIAAGSHKLAYVGACIGKSPGYVSRMAKGKRPIPNKLVQPLCAATGSLLLAQFLDLQRALERPDDVQRLAEMLRESAA